MSSRDTFTAEVPREIEKDESFKDWEDDLDGSLLIKLEAAIEKIENEGVVTSAKDLGEGLYEKKW
jgi:hypothetical protein